MANNVQTTAVSTMAMQKASNLLTRFRIKIGMSTRSALKPLQTARMISTLSNMNDAQLSQVGISRPEIPKYAEQLTADR